MKVLNVPTSEQWVRLTTQQQEMWEILLFYPRYVYNFYAWMYLRGSY